jgi:osmotically-inducible protein OsmY
VSIKDEALAASVQPIMVRAVDGEVFLKGRVDSEEQRKLAGMVVRGVPGVRHVRMDELEVREEQE